MDACETRLALCNMKNIDIYLMLLSKFLTRRNPWIAARTLWNWRGNVEPSSQSITFSTNLLVAKPGMSVGLLVQHKVSRLQLGLLQQIHQPIVTPQILYRELQPSMSQRQITGIHEFATSKDMQVGNSLRFMQLYIHSHKALMTQNFRTAVVLLCNTAVTCVLCEAPLEASLTDLQTPHYNSF